MRDGRVTEAHVDCRGRVLRSPRPLTERYVSLLREVDAQAHARASSFQPSPTTPRSSVTSSRSTEELRARVAVLERELTVLRRAVLAAGIHVARDPYE